MSVITLRRRARKHAAGRGEHPYPDQGQSVTDALAALDAREAARPVPAFTPRPPAATAPMTVLREDRPLLERVLSGLRDLDVTGAHPFDAPPGTRAAANPARLARDPLTAPAAGPVPAMSRTALLAADRRTLPFFAGTLQYLGWHGVLPCRDDLKFPGYLDPGAWHEAVQLISAMFYAALDEVHSRPATVAELESLMLAERTEAAMAGAA